MNAPFTPLVTATLSASATSSSVSLAPDAYTLELQNAGNSTVFVRVGSGAQTAVTTGYPVLAGQSKVISKARNADTLAGICASGETATLYVTSGSGV